MDGPPLVSSSSSARQPFFTCAISEQSRGFCLIQRDVAWLTSKADAISSIDGQRASSARRRVVPCRCSSCRRRAGRAVPPACSCLAVGPRHDPWAVGPARKHGVSACRRADLPKSPADPPRESRRREAGRAGGGEGDGRAARARGNCSRRAAAREGAAAGARTRGRGARELRSSGAAARRTGGRRSSAVDLGAELGANARAGGGELADGGATATAREGDGRS